MMGAIKQIVGWASAASLMPSWMPRNLIIIRVVVCPRLQMADKVATCRPAGSMRLR
jgi:hypothetical protein